MRNERNASATKRFLLLAAALTTIVLGCGRAAPSKVVVTTDAPTSASSAFDESARVDSESTFASAPANVAASEEPTASVASVPIPKSEQKFDAKGVSVELIGAFDGVNDPADMARWRAVKVVRGSGELTSGALETFAQLPNLTEFLWQDARVSESSSAAFARFAQSPKLRKLRLTGLRLAEGGAFSSFVQSIAQAPSLEELDLCGSAIAASDLSSVDFSRGFLKLKKLNLYQTSVGDAGVVAILPLADRLVWLNLDDARITPNSAPELAKFAKLEFLHVGRSTLDDTSVDSLSKLSNLKKIHVTRSGVTEEGAERLRKAIPGCEVVSQPEN